jgi:UDP-N-acetyl-D-glucosamine dehydrogenase
VGTPSAGAVAIVGMGYVGLSLAKVFADSNFEVFGIDNSGAKIEKLKSGSSPITDLSDGDVAEMIRNGFKPSMDFGLIRESSAVILALPTPLGADSQPDLAPLLTAVDHASPHFQEGQLWVVESTVLPGVTEGPVLERIRAGSHQNLEAILLAYSPERIDPGSSNRRLTSIPKIVAGTSESSLSSAASLYQSIGFTVVEAKSIRAAETAKLLENTYRAVNLALVNELVQLVGRAGIDFHEVVRLAETKPFGFQAFWPGPGVGGHCIPIDPWYLQSFLAEKGGPSRLTELALTINSDMPTRTAQRILDVGNHMGLFGELPPQVNLLGMSYKSDVNDFRDSPGPEVARELSRRGVSVSYHDPFLGDELPEGHGRWLAHDRELTGLSGMTVLLQNHAEYRKLFRAPQGSTTLFSASSGQDQIAPSIWSPDFFYVD